MTQRLTLSTVGIKSPLDINRDDESTAAKTQTADGRMPAAPTPPASRGKPAKSPARSTLKIAEPAPAQAPAPFYGTGRPVQTSVAIDQDCSDRLDELARATGASLNALAVAAIHGGLPTTTEAAQQLIVGERVSRAGTRQRRIERNLRMPQQLRTRADELVAAARTRLPRAARADLLNAALRRGLPTDAQQAAELVEGHAQRIEKAAAGT